LSHRTRVELLDQLGQIKSSFEHDICEAPGSVLSEADLQGLLFARLREQFDRKMKLQNWNSELPIEIGEVYLQYRIYADAGSIRPDIVILDHSKINPTELRGSPKNKYGFLWTLPVAAIIEMKYAGYGDVPRHLGAQVHRDFKKVARMRDVPALRDAIVWLSGFDQRTNCFCSSEWYTLGSEREPRDWCSHHGRAEATRVG